MENSTIDIINIFLHVVLLGIKFCLAYIIYIWFAKDNKIAKYIFFFLTIIIAQWEIYFLLNFYSDLDLYYYEFAALTDQIVTALLLMYFIKEVKNGKD